VSEIPWFWPGVAASILVAFAIGERVARWAGGTRLVGILMVAALGMVVAATLTPGREALESGMTGIGGCDVRRVTPPSVQELAAIPEVGLNMLLYVPLGLAIALLSATRRRTVIAMLALALPATIEGSQMIALSLDRVCESADIVDNMTGLVLGLAGGWLVTRLTGAA
jgi:hypothetical protein